MKITSGIATVLRTLAKPFVYVGKSLYNVVSSVFAKIASMSHQTTKTDASSTGGSSNESLQGRVHLLAVSEKDIRDAEEWLLAHYETLQHPSKSSPEENYNKGMEIIAQADSWMAMFPNPVTRMKFLKKEPEFQAQFFISLRAKLHASPDKQLNAMEIEQAFYELNPVTESDLNSLLEYLTTPGNLAYDVQKNTLLMAFFPTPGIRKEFLGKSPRFQIDFLEDLRNKLTLNKGQLSTKQIEAYFDTRLNTTMIGLANLKRIETIFPDPKIRQAFSEVCRKDPSFEERFYKELRTMIQQSPNQEASTEDIAGLFNLLRPR